MSAIKLAGTLAVDLRGTHSVSEVSANSDDYHKTDQIKLLAFRKLDNMFNSLACCDYLNGINTALTISWLYSYRTDFVGVF